MSTSGPEHTSPHLPLPDHASHVVRGGPAHAPAALAASEDLAAFAALIQGATDYAIFRLDAQGTVVSWNAGAERLLGYGAEAIIGESFERFFTPEDRGADLPDRELRTARERGLAEDENWLVRQDGTRLWASGQTTPLYDTQGTLLGFAKLCRDRTQHRRSEDAMRAQEVLLRTVLETLPLGVWIIDRTGQIVHGNAAAHEIWADLRYARPDQFGEYKGWLVSTGKQLNADEWASARAITRGETTLAEELEIETFDGTRKLIRNWAVPIHDDYGEVTGAVVVNEDITAQRHAERARDAFVEAVSHDLKNPLVAIRGVAQLGERQTAALPTREADTLGNKFAAIVRSADRMTAIINELVDVTRLQTGQPVALQVSPTNLVGLVGRVADKYRQATKLHTISLHATMPTLVGTWDARRLERVFENLLTNAIRYSPAGGDIDIHVERTADADGTWARVAVTDHGLGVPPADLPHIFDPGRRGSNVGHIEGSGIGLAGAARIVERHGGRIDANSHLGGGSTVTVWLPSSRGS